MLFDKKIFVNRLVKALTHPRWTATHLLEATKLFLPQSNSRILADAENFWNCDHQSRLPDDSHWLGKGRWTKQKDWIQIGKIHWNMFEKLCLLSGTARPIQRMIEWGPGGGANAARFCFEVQEFFGDDISKANLAECQHRLEASGLKGFRPILVDIRHPEQCLQFFNNPVEFFLSTAVYQHFPNKEYGIRVTELAYKLLRDKGLALIQIRYDSGAKRFRPKRRDYHKNMITFTSYGIDEFWEIVRQIGFKPLAVTLETSTHYAYFCLQKNASIRETSETV
ncbi:MAG: class I SAM-dependent methyltransferase [Deltaproteobacteria bacterium]